MKLYQQADFPCDANTIWEVFSSDAFAQELEAQTGIAVTILERIQEGEIEVERMRCVSKKELPKVMAKALGSKHLTYNQENRLDRASGRLTWRVDLPVLKDRVDVAGTTTVTTIPGGVRRTVDGEIHVKIRFVGGAIEKTIVTEFGKSYERASEIARRLVSEPST